MKKRIDLLLVEKGYFESRERAKKAIMAGVVFVNNHNWKFRYEWMKMEQ